eukprot:m.65890 g.65890  ORF g.65890 m.65890 type:complete len:65 (+) comp35338_c0_seq2:333-527(+)
MIHHGLATEEIAKASAKKKKTAPIVTNLSAIFFRGRPNVRYERKLPTNCTVRKFCITNRSRKRG